MATVDTKTDEQAARPSNITEHKLQKEQELRFEVNEADQITIQLKSGFAEAFGTELTRGQKYTFLKGTKMAIFTWQGCTLIVDGEAEMYVSKETPMNFYLNIHGILEKFRQESASMGTRGPTVMVCGPTDVGKTTLCRLLLNYAIRKGHTPAYVDIDVGQGSLGIPGTMGINVMETPADVANGFSIPAPLLYHYGSFQPGLNQNLYELLIGRCADAINKRHEIDPKVKHSGTIINTCGWTSGGGFKALKHAAQAFAVTVVLVLDQEKLYNELVRDLPKFIRTHIVFTPKSGGVVTRSKEFRAESRDFRIREYFYGTGIKGSQVTQFYPHSFEVPFHQMKVYKIGAPAIPDSCLPIGMKPDDNQTKLVAVTPGLSLLNHMLSLTFSTDKNKAADSNVQGFVCVTAVDMDRQMVTVLSPQPKPLPTDYIFLISEVQFMDSH